MKYDKSLTFKITDKMCENHHPTGREAPVG